MISEPKLVTSKSPHKDGIDYSICAEKHAATRIWQFFSEDNARAHGANYELKEILSTDELPVYLGVDQDILPLGFDPVRVQVGYKRIGKTRIIIEHFQSRIWYHEFQTSDTVYFGLVLPGDDPVRFNASMISKPSLVSWVGNGGQETDYVFEPGTQNYIIEIPADMARNRGWVLPPPRILQIEGNSARKAAAYLDCLSAKVKSSTAPYPKPQDSILLSLLDALTSDTLYCDQPETASARSLLSHKKVVGLACEYLQQQDEQDGDVGSQISKAIGTSRRTLYAAFKTHLGVGPSQLHRIQKLYTLRRRLISASPEETSVAAAMHDAGFSQLGRTSGLYHEHFGELPSETLRRVS